ncbi:MAG: CC0125/CC1285 family lipoprotein [Thermodesulfobacteriota bacterium]
MRFSGPIKFGLAVLICIWLLSFVGCAATPYQPAEENFAGGYTDIKMRPDTYRISFEGNAYITGEKAYQYTLYRAAEIAMEHDCKWFEVLNQDEKTRRDWAGFLGYVEKPRNSIIVRLVAEDPSADAYSAVDIMNSINVK